MSLGLQKRLVTTYIIARYTRGYRPMVVRGSLANYSFFTGHGNRPAIADNSLLDFGKLLAESAGYSSSLVYFLWFGDLGLQIC